MGNYTNNEMYKICSLIVGRNSGGATSTAMPANKISTYRSYNAFFEELDGADDPAAILAAATRFFPFINAATSAILKAPQGTPRNKLQIIAQQGHASFWLDYLRICSANCDPLTRVLRIVPHPVALSDFHGHPTLFRRAAPTRQLLMLNGFSDAFAVPIVDRQFNLWILLIAGCNLNLRPTQRHLLTQIAADSVQRLLQTATVQPSERPPQHLKLTKRQMEIAAWIVAGKSDWEIGEILRISAKTVNFHVENIKRTYGVKSRSQFVAAIIHEGGIAPLRATTSRQVATWVAAGSAP